MNKALTIIITIILTAAISSTATYVVVTKVLPEDKETTATVNNGNGATQNNQNANSEKNQLVGGEQTKTSVDYCDVDIKSARLAEDEDGKPVIVVKYVFKNNSLSEDPSFSKQFSSGYLAYQNGIELPDTVDIAEGDSYNDLYKLKYSEVKQGSSLEVEVAYELLNTATDVIIEVLGDKYEESAGFFATRTFKLQ